MRELTQIDTTAAHACESPKIERWHVLEPVSGRWAWLTVFGCCDKVVEELDPATSEAAPAPVKKAA